jgi:hypothetical protein
MQVFLSWSGTQSHALADALRRWLPHVVQSIEPWLSSGDIEAGARWQDEIGANLEETSFGILCLTKANLLAPWILFEAGAISKLRRTARVCTYLYDLRPAEVPFPLAMFQATTTERDSTFALVTALNRHVEKPLRGELLSEAFEAWWPKLESLLATVGLVGVSEDVVPQRNDRDMLQEIVAHLREMRSEREAVLELLLRTGSTGSLMTSEQRFDSIKKCASGMNDQDLARRLGVSHATISRLRILDRDPLRDERD